MKKLDGSEKERKRRETEEERGVEKNKKEGGRKERASPVI